MSLSSLPAVYRRLPFFSSLLLSLLGCSSANLLPSTTTTTESPWQSFSEAKASFDRIIPGKTRVVDLKQLGFDPFTTPNIKQITYLEIIQQFMPNQSISLKDLDAALQGCIQARKACYGYEIRPALEEEQRYGNVALDILNFRRQKRITGWKFTALLVLNEDAVIYKLWSGEPHILMQEDKRNPLGPFQNVGNILSFDLNK